MIANPHKGVKIGGGARGQLKPSIDLYNHMVIARGFCHGRNGCNVRMVAVA